MERDDEMRSTLRDLFADREPRGKGEVVEATGLEDSVVTDALRALTTVGELAEKTIGEGDSEMRIWYPTPDLGVDSGNGAEYWTGDDGDGTTTFELQNAETGGRTRRRSAGMGQAQQAEDEIERAVTAIDVPGASEMMRSWRRDALRAAAAYLAEHETLRSMTIIEEIYPRHRAGYEDRDQWWAFVSDRLAQLPQVRQEGDVWEFDR